MDNIKVLNLKRKYLLANITSQLLATQLAQVKIWKAGDEDLYLTARTCASLAEDVLSLIELHELQAEEDEDE